MLIRASNRALKPVVFNTDRVVLMEPAAPTDAESGSGTVVFTDVQTGQGPMILQLANPMSDLMAKMGLAEEPTKA